LIQWVEEEEDILHHGGAGMGAGNVGAAAASNGLSAMVTVPEKDSVGRGNEGGGGGNNDGDGCEQGRRPRGTSAC
jgi:hypothetical protein